MRTDKFLLLANCINSSSLEPIIKAGRPDRICGIDTLPDLNGLTLGELIELQSIDFESMKDLMLIPPKILLKLPEKKLLLERAETLLAFSFWCLNEVKNISEMFGQCGVKPTPEEVEAGIDRLTTDSFTLVDYYALRMGYHDHAEVEKVPWVRVYRCYKADAESKEFERRLYKVINKKK